jgi:hypothetical protein
MVSSTLLVILPPGLLARVVRSFSKNENVFSKRVARF